MAKKPVLYSKTPAEETFEIVNGILGVAGRPLSNEDLFRLKSEALAFKSTSLYKLLAVHTADQMQKEIVDNCKTMEEINYYRAILADRRMLIQEIDSFAKADIKPPTIKVDTKNQ